MSNELPLAWSTVWPAVADHLWQSTLFAMFAALPVVVCRANHARVRYGIWCAASLKFLVPFAGIVWLGAQVEWTPAASIAPPTIAAAIERIGEPFSAGRSTILEPPAFRPAGMTTDLKVGGSEEGGVTADLKVGSSRERPAILERPAFRPAGPIVLALWLAGSAAVLLVRWRSWRRVATLYRASRPVSVGREADALARVRQLMNIRTRVQLRASDAVLEPGVVGLFRPALLWPRQLASHLSDSQVEAIFVHELSHVRRRDNLTSALHMIVETLFWFHPVVWMLSSRLVAERERACDEAVLAFGAAPREYADGLLTVCKLCLESPLPCVSGVTGSNLKRRVLAIASGECGRALRWTKKIALSASAAAVVFAPLMLGVLRGGAVHAESKIDALLTPVTTTLKTAAESTTMASVAPVPIATPPAPLPIAGKAQTSTPLRGRVIAAGDTVHFHHGPPTPATVSVQVTGEWDEIPGLGRMRLEGTTDLILERVLQTMQRADLDGVTQRMDESRARRDGLAPEAARQFAAPRPALFNSAVPITVTITPQTAPLLNVYVSGQVQAPGQVSVTSAAPTVMRAIRAASNFTAMAGPDVIVLHKTQANGPVAPDDPGVERRAYSQKGLRWGVYDPPVEAGDTIWVSTAASFSINGEVKSAGERAWEPTMTVFGAIALAGGLTSNARLGMSTIRRKNATGGYDPIGHLRDDTPILRGDVLTIGRKPF